MEKYTLKDLVNSDGFKEGFSAFAKTAITCSIVAAMIKAEKEGIKTIPITNITKRFINNEPYEEREVKTKTKVYKDRYEPSYWMRETSMDAIYESYKESLEEW